MPYGFYTRTFLSYEAPPFFRILSSCLPYYIGAPHFLHIRVFVFPSTLYPTRVAFWHFSQTIFTFDTSKGLGICTIWPFCPARLARTCLVRMLIPSTTILASWGSALTTFPFRPRSFPRSQDCG